MIIFVNGSINSGKSTVAKALQDKIQNSAVVEIDNLHAFIEKYVPIGKAIDLNFKNAFCVIKNLVDVGMDIIVPYVISEKNYLLIINELEKLDVKIVFVTLDLPLEKVLESRGKRDLSEWEIERIKYHYSIGINKPNFGLILDTSKLSVEDTVKEIIDLI